jgi:DNA polymerase sigma
MHDDLSGLSIDISFNKVNGIESAQIVRSYLENPVYGDGVRILMVLLKQFLAQRHLNEVYSGGLGSYGLIMMIVSFLQVIFLS